MLTADQFKEAARKAAAAGDVATARSLIARAKAAEQTAPPKSLYKPRPQRAFGSRLKKTWSVTMTHRP